MATLEKITLDNSSIDALEELLVCAVCFERFDEPKTLHCLHTFCLQCLRRHLQSNTGTNHRINYLHIICPTCREVTPIKDGLNSLKGDFKVSKISNLCNGVLLSGNKCSVCQSNKSDDVANYYCFECKIKLCDACFAQHEAVSVYSSHTINTFKDDKRLKCLVHSKVLQYYCLDCEYMVCAVCPLADHAKHRITDVPTGKSYLNYCEIFGKLASELPEKKAQLGIYLAKNNFRKETLESSYHNATKTINSRCDEMVNEIESQRWQLLSRAREQYNKSQALFKDYERVTAETTEGIEVNLKEIQNCIHHGGTIQYSFISKCWDTLEQANMLLGNVFAELEPVHTATVHFMPYKYDVMVGEISPLVRGLDFQVTSLCKSKCVGLYGVSGIAMTTFGNIMISDFDGYKLQQYQVDYGCYNPSIDNSKPASVIAKPHISFVQELEVGDIIPSDITISSVNTYLVADMLHSSIRVYDENGIFLDQYATDLSRLASVAHHPNGDVLAGDFTSGGIAKSNGYNTLFFSGDFIVPHKMYCTEEDFYVHDITTGEVHIRAQCENYQERTIERIDDEPLLVVGMGVDESGLLYICDAVSCTVMQYSSHGKFMDTIIRDLVDPQAMCITKYGLIAVVTKEVPAADEATGGNVSDDENTTANVAPVACHYIQLYQLDYL